MWWRKSRPEPVETLLFYIGTADADGPVELTGLAAGSTLWGPTPFGSPAAHIGEELVIRREEHSVKIIRRQIA